jgi:hypothetical protein
VTREDPSLQVLQPRARIQAEVVGQRGMAGAVDRKSIGTAMRPVQRCHQLSAQLFAKRVLGDE